MTELGGQIVVLTNKKNDEQLHAMIGDEGRKRQHTRNDVDQMSVCRTIPLSGIKFPLKD